MKRIGELSTRVRNMATRASLRGDGRGEMKLRQIAESIDVGHVELLAKISKLKIEIPLFSCRALTEREIGFNAGIDAVLKLHGVKR